MTGTDVFACEGTSAGDTILVHAGIYSYNRYEYTNGAVVFDDNQVDNSIFENVPMADARDDSRIQNLYDADRRRFSQKGISSSYAAGEPALDGSPSD